MRLAIAMPLSLLAFAAAPISQAQAADSILNEAPSAIATGDALSHPLSYHPGILLAQSEGDDSYDPFSDYSEFEESVEEEEDINFFRNGRLLTIGFLGGYRAWTGNLGAIYSGSPAFGLFLSYFFDLRFALQIGYLTSDHTMVVKGVPGTDTVQGSVSASDVSFLLKYYFNTQNVTRGLADLNPYVVGGFSQIYRTINVSGVDGAAKDSAFGFNVGAGLEIPMMRNKMFFGAQGNYQIVNFADEGTVIRDVNDQKTGVTPNGDSWLVIGVLGVNF
jgi:hypothetical protein